MAVGWLVTRSIKPRGLPGNRINEPDPLGWLFQLSEDGESPGAGGVRIPGKYGMGRDGVGLRGGGD